jgi:glycosyltransferase involved in cell wall biosynthesis
MKKRLRKIIDVYRVWGLKRSSEIILETDILYHRAGRSLGFKDKKLHVVRMTASRLVNLNKVEQPDVDYFQDKIGNGFNVLYLSGAHPNKRIHLLINVAKELLKKSVKLKFITTMPEDSRYYKSIAKSILENGLESYFVNLGSVEPSCVASLISSVDALINIALLESFSNNWVEAWAMEKPLIVTDSDWAKGSCGDAAVYVDPSNPSATAMSLEKLSSESNFRNALIEEGKKKLSACPTSEEKNQMYLDILSKVRQ